MLDFGLINFASKHTALQFSKKVATDIPGLYTLEHFLPTPLLDKLINFAQSHDKWDYETTVRTKRPYPNRMKLNWVPDTVIEEIHMVLDSLTNILNEEFERHNQFIGLSIWKDLPGYSIEKHTDNPIIDFALQIYLSGDPSLNLGTIFENDNQKFCVDYTANTGYIMDNTKKIPHSMPNTVPASYNRYSLYAIWSKTNNTHS